MQSQNHANRKTGKGDLVSFADRFCAAQRERRQVLSANPENCQIVYRVLCHDIGLDRFDLFTATAEDRDTLAIGEVDDFRQDVKIRHDILTVVDDESGTPKRTGRPTRGLIGSYRNNRRTNLVYGVGKRRRR